mmetsp:Transcript_5064/g.11004  ORF Transcript_5064/g.11004 Transcript_5064/m.11004 type:complete len:223 (-) Transcript_5064:521-1189(-)
MMKRQDRWRSKACSPTAVHRSRSSSSSHHLYWLRTGMSSWLRGRTRSSLPSACPRGADETRKVEATNTPPGASTRLISAMAAWGFGQQWMAAPAWMACTLPVAKGRRPTSARSKVMGVLPLMVPSCSKYALACCSMLSEKSAATTPLNLPDLANLREKRPLPQLMSTTTLPYAGARYSMAMSVSLSTPGKPAQLKPWRQPRSYTKLTRGLLNNSVPPHSLLL